MHNQILFQIRTVQKEASINVTYLSTLTGWPVQGVEYMNTSLVPLLPTLPFDITSAGTPLAAMADTRA
jgi:hypothetical protein